MLLQIGAYFPSFFGWRSMPGGGCVRYLWETAALPGSISRASAASGISGDYEPRFNICFYCTREQWLNLLFSSRGTLLR